MGAQGVRDLSLRILLCLGLLVAQNLSAADLPRLKDLFIAHFWNTEIYQDSQCGDNVRRFIALAKKLGIDVKGAEILVIYDKGMASLEGAKAYMAREDGDLLRPRPARPPFREVGDAEWGHHVVLRVGGQIIDFDFLNEPSVIAERAYFFHMFLDPNYRNDLAQIKNLLGNYALEIRDEDAKLKREGKIRDLYPEWLQAPLDCSEYLKKT